VLITKCDFIRNFILMSFIKNIWLQLFSLIVVVFLGEFVVRIASSVTA
jgi:hypothetical protein